VPLLELLEREVHLGSGRLGGGRREGCARPLEAHVAGLEEVPSAEEQRPLEDVPQLADVARPRVGAEGPLGLGRDADAPAPDVAREPLEELAGQDRDVLRPLPERGMRRGIVLIRK